MLIKLGKIIFLIFMLYLEWFKEAFYTIDILMYGLLVALTVVLFIDMKKTGNIKKVVFPSILKMYFCLLLFSFITGVFIVVNQELFISFIVRLAVFSCLCMECHYIIQRDNSVKWLLNIFIICALFCSFQTVVNGVSYTGGAVITMSHHNNPNKLGIIMVFGAMAALYDKISLDKKPVIYFFMILSFIYVTMLAASRKSFVSILFIFLIWIINYWQYSFSLKMVIKKLKNIALFSAFFVLSLLLLMEKYESTALFIRMTTFLTQEGMNTRLQLYRDAIDMWKDNPILGVGYGQFGVLNSFTNNLGTFYYSHSTYAELLSCTGIIGFLIFFIPVIKKFINCSVTLYQSKRIMVKDKIVNYKLQMIFVYFAIELFIATSQILIYELDHMLFLIVIFTEIDYLKRSVIFLR